MGIIITKLTISILCIAAMIFIVIFRLKIDKKSKLRNHILIGSSIKTFFTSFALNSTMVLVLLILANGELTGFNKEHELVMWLSLIVGVLLFVLTFAFYFPVGYIDKDSRDCLIYQVYKKGLKFNIDDINEIVVKQKAKLVDYYILIPPIKDGGKMNKILMEKSMGGLKDIISLYTKRTGKQVVIYDEYISKNPRSDLK